MSIDNLQKEVNSQHIHITYPIMPCLDFKEGAIKLLGTGQSPSSLVIYGWITPNHHMGSGSIATVKHRVNH